MELILTNMMYRYDLISEYIGTHSPCIVFMCMCACASAVFRCVAAAFIRYADTTAEKGEMNTQIHRHYP